MRRPTAVLLVVATIFAGPALAQEVRPSEDGSPSTLSAGSRVRVKMNDAPEYLDLPDRVDGRLVRWTADRIVVMTPARQNVAIPVAAIQKVQVPAGRHSRMRYGAIGLLVGAAAGVTIGAVGALADGGGDSEEHALATMALGCFGATLGFLGGLAAPPAERWETVSEPRVRVAVQPLVGPRGAGLGVRVSF